MACTSTMAEASTSTAFNANEDSSGNIDTYLDSLKSLTANGILIDIQYFRNKSNVIMVKELAILKLSTMQLQFMTFKPETGSEWSKLSELVKRTNHFIAENVNGLNYFEGTYDYELLPRILHNACKSSTLIYCKGSEKCKFLSNLLGKKVHNLESIYGLFSTDYQKQFRSQLYCRKFMSCFHDHGNGAIMYCSLNKVCRLKDRLKHFYKEECIKYNVSRKVKHQFKYDANEIYYSDE